MIKDTSASDVQLGPENISSVSKKVKIVLGLIALTVIVLFAFTTLRSWWSSDVSIKAADLRRATVVRGDFVRDVSVQGRIVAAIKPSYYSKSAGTVSLLVKAGDAVEKDQVLASIFSPELESQLQQEQARLEELSVEVERQRISTKQQIAENQRTIDLATLRNTAAKRELERSKKAWEKGVISKIDYERSGDDHNTAKVEFKHSVASAGLAGESLEFELKTSELQLERQRLLTQEVERRIKELEIKSGVAGIVGEVRVDEQNAVNANQQLLTVIDLSAFEIETDIPEVYADEIAVSMAAAIKYNGEEFPGAVSSISPEVINGQVKSVIRFDGRQPEGLRQNQRVTIRIVLEEKTDVLKVRKGAFLDGTLGRYVYAIDGNTAIKRSVSLGSQSVSEIEVLSGLQAGEEIVLSDTTLFKEAEKIFISN